MNNKPPKKSPKPSAGAQPEAMAAGTRQRRQNTVRVRVLGAPQSSPANQTQPALKARSASKPIAQSKRVPHIRVAEPVLSAAMDLFDGNEAAAHRWLQTPLPALEGNDPVSLLRTAQGTQRVLKLIRQLDQGVYV